MEKISNQRSGDVVRRVMRAYRLAFALWLTACHTWRVVRLATPDQRPARKALGTLDRYAI